MSADFWQKPLQLPGQPLVCFSEAYKFGVIGTGWKRDGLQCYNTAGSLEHISFYFQEGGCDMGEGRGEDRRTERGLLFWEDIHAASVASQTMTYRHTSTIPRL